MCQGVYMKAGIEPVGEVWIGVLLGDTDGVALVENEGLGCLTGCFRDSAVVTPYPWRLLWSYETLITLPQRRSISHRPPRRFLAVSHLVRGWFVRNGKAVDVQIRANAIDNQEGPSKVHNDGENKVSS